MPRHDNNSFIAPAAIFLAFVLLFLTCISVPFAQGIRLFTLVDRRTGESIRFGIWGYCLRYGVDGYPPCSKPELGWTFDNVPTLTGLEHAISSEFTSSLVIHPLVTAGIFVIFVLTAPPAFKVSYQHNSSEPRQKSSLRLLPTALILIAAISATVVCIIDAIIVAEIKSDVRQASGTAKNMKAYTGAIPWLSFVAALVLWIGTVLSGFLSGKKRSRARESVDDMRESEESTYGRDEIELQSVHSDYDRKRTPTDYDVRSRTATMTHVDDRDDEWQSRTSHDRRTQDSRARSPGMSNRDTSYDDDRSRKEKGGFFASICPCFGRDKDRNEDERESDIEMASMTRSRSMRTSDQFRSGSDDLRRRKTRTASDVIFDDAGSTSDRGYASDVGDADRYTRSRSLEEVPVGYASDNALSRTPSSPYVDSDYGRDVSTPGAQSEGLVSNYVSEERPRTRSGFGERNSYISREQSYLDDGDHGDQCSDHTDMTPRDVDSDREGYSDAEPVAAAYVSDRRTPIISDDMSGDGESYYGSEPRGNSYVSERRPETENGGNREVTDYPSDPVHSSLPPQDERAYSPSEEFYDEPLSEERPYESEPPLSDREVTDAGVMTEPAEEYDSVNERGLTSPPRSEAFEEGGRTATSYPAEPEPESEFASGEPPVSSYADREATISEHDSAPLSSEVQEEEDRYRSMENEPPTPVEEMESIDERAVTEPPDDSEFFSGSEDRGLSESEHELEPEPVESGFLSEREPEPQPESDLDRGASFRSDAPEEPITEYSDAGEPLSEERLPMSEHMSDGELSPEDAISEPLATEPPEELEEHELTRAPTPSDMLPDDENRDLPETSYVSELEPEPEPEPEPESEFEREASFQSDHTEGLATEYSEEPLSEHMSDGEPHPEDTITEPLVTEPPEELEERDLTRTPTPSEMSLEEEDRDLAGTSYVSQLEPEPEPEPESDLEREASLQSEVSEDPVTGYSDEPLSEHMSDGELPPEEGVSEPPVSESPEDLEERELTRTATPSDMLPEEEDRDLAETSHVSELSPEPEPEPEPESELEREASLQSEVPEEPFTEYSDEPLSEHMSDRELPPEDGVSEPLVTESPEDLEDRGLTRTPTGSTLLPEEEDRDLAETSRVSELAPEPEPGPESDHEREASFQSDVPEEPVTEYSDEPLSEHMSDRELPPEDGLSEPPVTEYPEDLEDRELMRTPTGSTLLPEEEDRDLAETSQVSELAPGPEPGPESDHEREASFQSDVPEEPITEYSDEPLSEHMSDRELPAEDVITEPPVTEPPEELEEHELTRTPTPSDIFSDDENRDLAETPYVSDLESEPEPEPGPESELEREASFQSDIQEEPLTEYSDRPLSEHTTDRELHPEQGVSDPPLTEPPEELEERELTRTPTPSDIELGEEDRDLAGTSHVSESVPEPEPQPESDLDREASLQSDMPEEPFTRYSDEPLSDREVTRTPTIPDMLSEDGDRDLAGTPHVSDLKPEPELEPEPEPEPESGLEREASFQSNLQEEPVPGYSDELSSKDISDRELPSEDGVSEPRVTEYPEDLEDRRVTRTPTLSDMSPEDENRSLDGISHVSQLQSEPEPESDLGREASFQSNLPEEPVTGYSDEPFSRDISDGALPSEDGVSESRATEYPGDLEDREFTRTPTLSDTSPEDKNLVGTSYVSELEPEPQPEPESDLDRGTSFRNDVPEEPVTEYSDRSLSEDVSDRELPLEDGISEPRVTEYSEGSEERSFTRTPTPSDTLLEDDDRSLAGSSHVSELEPEPSSDLDRKASFHSDVPEGPLSEHMSDGEVPLEDAVPEPSVTEPPEDLEDRELTRTPTPSDMLPVDEDRDLASTPHTSGLRPEPEPKSYPERETSFQSDAPEEPITEYSDEPFSKDMSDRELAPESGVSEPPMTEPPEDLEERELTRTPTPSEPESDLDRGASFQSDVPEEPVTRYSDEPLSEEMSDRELPPEDAVSEPLVTGSSEDLESRELTRTPTGSALLPEDEIRYLTESSHTSGLEPEPEPEQESNRERDASLQGDISVEPITEYSEAPVSEASEPVENSLERELTRTPTGSDLLPRGEDRDVPETDSRLSLVQEPVSDRGSYVQSYVPENRISPGPPSPSVGSGTIRSTNYTATDPRLSPVQEPVSDRASYMQSYVPEDRMSPYSPVRSASEGYLPGSLPPSIEGGSIRDTRYPESEARFSPVSDRASYMQSHVPEDRISPELLSPSVEGRTIRGTEYPETEPRLSPVQGPVSDRTSYMQSYVPEDRISPEPLSPSAREGSIRDTGYPGSEAGPSPVQEPVSDRASYVQSYVPEDRMSPGPPLSLSAGGGSIRGSDYPETDRRLSPVQEPLSNRDSYMQSYVPEDRISPYSPVRSAEESYLHGSLPPSTEGGSIRDTRYPEPEVRVSPAQEPVSGRASYMQSYVPEDHISQGSLSPSAGGGSIRGTDYPETGPRLSSVQEPVSDRASYMQSYVPEDRMSPGPPLSPSAGGGSIRGSDYPETDRRLSPVQEPLSNRDSYMQSYVPEDRMSPYSPVRSASESYLPGSLPPSNEGKSIRDTRYPESDPRLSPVQEPASDRASYMRSYVPDDQISPEPLSPSVEDGGIRGTDYLETDPRLSPVQEPVSDRSGYTQSYVPEDRISPGPLSPPARGESIRETRYPESEARFSPAQEPVSDRANYTQSYVPEDHISPEPLSPSAEGGSIRDTRYLEGHNGSDAFIPHSEPFTPENDSEPERFPSDTGDRPSYSEGYAPQPLLSSAEGGSMRRTGYPEEQSGVSGSDDYVPSRISSGIKSDHVCSECENSLSEMSGAGGLNGDTRNSSQREASTGPGDNNMTRICEYCGAYIYN